MPEVTHIAPLPPSQTPQGGPGVAGVGAIRIKTVYVGTGDQHADMLAKPL